MNAPRERVAQLAPYAAVDREGGRVPGRRRDRRGGRGQTRLDRQLRGGTARPAQPSGADRAARPEPGRGLGGVGLRTDAVAGRRPVSQDLTGLPTLSAATGTTRSLLAALGLTPAIPDAGALLSPADVSPSEPLTVRWASPCG